MRIVILFLVALFVLPCPVAIAESNWSPDQIIDARSVPPAVMEAFKQHFVIQGDYLRRALVDKSCSWVDKSVYRGLRGWTSSTYIESSEDFMQTDYWYWVRSQRQPGSKRWTPVTWSDFLAEVATKPTGETTIRIKCTAGGGSPNIPNF